MTRVQSYLSYALFVAVSCGVWWQPLARTFSLALHNDEYTYLFLILPVSATLILLEWRSQKAAVQANFRLGSVLLIIVVLLTGFANWKSAGLADDVQISVGMLALLLWWIASFVVCFGTRAARSFLFPLLFLFWMVPIPSLPLNRAVEFLQAQSTIASRLMFSLIGVPVSQQGFVLSIPGVNIEVARECSSIRSSVMLLIASTVIAQLNLRSAWHKALVIMAAIPLCIAKNALRIVTLSVLGTRVDPGFLTGKLHHQGGIVFFMVSLAILAAFVWMLRRAERHIPLAELNPLKAPALRLQDPH
jgi:exosortase